jgi:glycosidase
MTHAPFSHLWRALLLPLFLLGACQSGTKSTPETAAAKTPTADAAAFTIKHPAWAANATLYQVNVRQYTPAGTFRAFEPDLPRLQKMGVGILWLMPINPIGLSHRKGTLGSAYSVRDYRAVNPDLGTLADLQHLVDEAHKLGMHVILDWVANHTSWDNALTKEHPDWYTRDAQGQFVPPVADWQDVIDLDYRQPGLRRYMTESMAYWVKTADIDGFRCDVAGLVPTDFWNDTRQELEKTKPVFMLAEWDELFPPTFLKKEEFTPNTHLLEKAFDATYALRLHSLLDSLGRDQKPTAELARYLAAERRMYSAGVSLMNFTSTHDINAWDGSEYERLGPNALPEAVLTALLPGIPMLYNGQEAAWKKRLRFFDKDTIRWNGYPLQGFYTTLLQLKKRHPALRNFDAGSQFRLLPSPKQTIVFERWKGRAAVVVAINLGAKPRQIRLPQAENSALSPLLDVFRRRPAPTDTLRVAAHRWRVLATN